MRDDLAVHVIHRPPRGQELRVFAERDDGSLHRIGTLSCSDRLADRILAILRAGAASVGRRCVISHDRGRSHERPAIAPRGD